jgi:Mce-associated membrane protein
MTSRNPTNRPRKIAGSGAKRASEEAPAEPERSSAEEGPSTGSPGLETGASAPSSTTDGPETGASAPSSTTDGPETGASAPSSTADGPETGASAPSSHTDVPETGASAPSSTTDEPSGRATPALVVAIVVLVAVGLLELAYLVGPLKDDAKVSGERPVLLSQAAERSAVDVAATAAVAASARSFETYDEQVDEAAALMTDAFAEEFRTTTDDAKADWVAGEIQVTADVAAQAVMTASEEQVEVLVFLNQFTTKTGEETGFTPFRLKITLIDDEDRGWLVSDIDAK